MSLTIFCLISTRITNGLVGLLLLGLRYESLLVAQPVSKQTPRRAIVDSIPQTKSLLTVTVKLVDAETDTIVAGAHLSAVDEKSGQSCPVYSDKMGLGVSAPLNAMLLIRASAPAYVTAQTRLPNLRLSQQIIMKLTHTKPSLLTIKAFATDISQPLSPAIAILTSLVTGRSEQVTLQNGRIERRFTQPDKLTIQVSSPGYRSVSRQMTIEVPPLGNRYEFDAELEKNPVEQPAGVMHERTEKSTAIPRLMPTSPVQTTPLMALKPVVAATKISPVSQQTNPASLSAVTTQAFSVLEKGKAIRLNAVYFDQSSPVLRPESHAELDQLYTVLNQNPNLRIEIRGHTDNQGDFNLNTQLSRDRCQAVIGYLIGKGIAKSRLKAVGRGPLDPIAPNNTEENRRKNRRVEFVAF